MNTETVKGLAEIFTSLSPTHLMALVVLGVLVLMWRVIDVLGGNKRK